jgi:hypothetical protein
MTNMEYSKTVFATKVVKPNIAKINFDKFDPILSSSRGCYGSPQQKAGFKKFIANSYRLPTLKSRETLMNEIVIESKASAVSFIDHLRNSNGWDGYG